MSQLAKNVNELARHGCRLEPVSSQGIPLERLISNERVKVPFGRFAASAVPHAKRQVA